MSKGWRIFWKTVLFFALGALFNIFGLIAWLIILFCWKGDDNKTNEYQESYYKLLYEKELEEQNKEYVKKIEDELRELRKK